LNKRAGLDLVFGFLLSGLMAGTFFLILYITGLLEFNGFNYGVASGAADGKSQFIQFMSIVSIGSLSLLLIEHIVVGYWEELAFRGYLLQNMIEGLGFALAIVISCLLYGLVHAGNPNAGLLSTGIIVLFGFLRIYGYLATKLLWLSMGMHIGWNFFQSPVFGFAASGHAKSTLFNITATGPGYLTGGDFGPEGSLIIIPILFGALGIMRWWAAKQDAEMPLEIES
jgi:membrane protease YdiL (CAAX protease family)